MTFPGVIEKLHNFLAPDEFLKQANLMFDVISKKTPQLARLNWLAILLANKCYHQISSTYFDNLLKKIEKALDDSNWSKAPWYLKLRQWLTFGYYPVPKITPVSEITIDVNLQGEEFQSHMPLRNFLPDHAFNSLGKERALLLSEFFRINAEKIALKNTSAGAIPSPVKTAEPPKSDEPQVSANKMKTQSLPSGTCVYNATPPSGTVKPKASASKMKTQSLPSGTCVYNATPPSDTVKPQASASKMKTQSLPSGTCVYNATPPSGTVKPKASASKMKTQSLPSGTFVSHDKQETPKIPGAPRFFTKKEQTPEKSAKSAKPSKNVRRMGSLMRKGDKQRNAPPSSSGKPSFKR
jgi:hypothetical protein